MVMSMVGVPLAGTLPCQQVPLLLLTGALFSVSMSMFVLVVMTAATAMPVFSWLVWVIDSIWDWGCLSDLWRR